MPRWGKMNLLATGYSESQVDVWPFAERNKISELKTVLDFGGRRLSLTSLGSPIIAAGSWNEGAGAYSVAYGKTLWSRRDLKQIQQVCDLSDNKMALIGVGLDSGAYRILRADTGEDQTRLAGIKKVYASSHEALYLLLDSSKHMMLLAI